LKSVKVVTLALLESLRPLAKDVADKGCKGLRNEGDCENDKWTIEMGGHIYQSDWK
jgi:hypothetical protein